MSFRILCNKCYRIDITGWIPPQRDTILPFPCLLLLNKAIRKFVAQHMECDTVVSYIYGYGLCKRMWHLNSRNKFLYQSVFVMLHLWSV